MTLEELFREEPGLARLEKRIRAERKHRRDPSYCANQAWIFEFKPELVKLVGWRAQKPQLRTSEAYDAAYDALYRLLPDCRNCACIALETAMGLRR